MNLRDWLFGLWLVLVPFGTIAAASLATLILFSLAQYLLTVVPAMTQDTEKDLLERIYLITNSLLFLVAAGALAYAAFQVSQSRAAQHGDALMRIDERWASEPMELARAEFRKVYNEAKALYDTFDPRPADQTEMASALLKATVHDRLLDLRDNDPIAYRRVMFILDFIETIGLLVGRRYIDTNDVHDLIGAPIIQMYTLMAAHVEWRREFWRAPLEYDRAEKLVARFKGYHRSHPAVTPSNRGS